MQPLRRDPAELEGLREGSNRHLESIPAVTDHTNVVEGSMWMVVISVLLFFIPAVNGFIGGLVGGYRIGTVGRAVMAAILPAVVASGILWFLLSQLDWPVLGFLAGMATVTLIVISNVGLFLGAIVGAVISSRR